MLKNNISRTVLFIFILTFSLNSNSQVTHGPIIGRPTSSSMTVWVRTQQPQPVVINYGTEPESLTNRTMIHTALKNDCTGWAELNNLLANTKYFYRLNTDQKKDDKVFTFKTLPSGKHYYNKQYNPDSLFNFSFHLGHCSNQSTTDFSKGDISAFKIMNEEWADKVDFAILNGDFIYEDARGYPVEDWQKALGEEVGELPEIVENAPSIVGVWQNYKNYLERSENLRNWHNSVPSYFILDDHEVLGDFYGAGEIGRDDRKTVFRDIGTKAWLDYIGWSNPMECQQNIYFGKGDIDKTKSTLTDNQSDFTAINLEEISNLHVHWGGLHAGVKEITLSNKEGNKNAGVYEIQSIIDNHTLKINPTPKESGIGSFSIGRQLYGAFSLGNCDFFLLDTKSNREMHDTKNPWKQGLSMLGEKQYNWLVNSVKKSKADFIFVVSSVSFMIPHTGTHRNIEVAGKDDSWTTFLEEREKLLNVFDNLDSKVFILSGDVHNSYSIEITDNVYEFLGGPISSRNHLSSHLNNIPPTGKVKNGGREFNIHWSTYLLPDTPNDKKNIPVFCVININNVCNNPVNNNSDRWIEYPNPQIVFQWYSGKDGKLLYAESIRKE
jgi:alkaline phosphatase D